jgi:hypothetical protein
VEKLLIPVYLPRRIYEPLVKLKRFLIPSTPIDRDSNVTQSFTQQFIQFEEQSSLDGRFHVKQMDWFPCLNDDTAATGFDAHYVLLPGLRAYWQKPGPRLTQVLVILFILSELPRLLPR